MKRTLFVGQAMPRVKRHLHDWPTLNAWLYSVGITQNQIEDNFLYSALVNYFPGTAGGSHRVPTPEEIKEERSRLKKTILKFDPEVMVPIGRLSISYCLNEKLTPLDRIIGKSFKVNPYGLFDREIIVIPFPHPSGASTWHHNAEHKKLLSKALNLLMERLSFEEPSGANH